MWSEKFQQERIIQQLLLSLLFVCTLSACSGPTEELIVGSTMGTTFSIKFVASDVDREQLEREINQELVLVNQWMSTYDPESELSIFNKTPVHESFPVSRPLIEVLKLAKLIHQQSDGAFDVTVGPLVNLWGFGPDPAKNSVPKDSLIEAALDQTGFQYLEVGDNELTRLQDIYVDLSAIAKGYGVDRVSDLLEQNGIGDYLVEIGGELRARGLKPNGEHWRIAIEKPDSLRRSVYTTLPLRQMSMATSGDYRNYFEVDGKRYSHTIDPRNGRPVTHQIASVTVLTAEAALADGYATAINVLGPEAGMLLAEQQNLAVLFIMKSEEGFIELTSTAMQSYISP